MTTTEDQPMNAAVYTRMRAGTASMTVRGAEIQQEQCRKLCVRNGWTMIVYTDYAGTGQYRPAYNQMLEDVEAGKVNVIVTTGFDRLHRKREKMEDLMGLLAAHGVTVLLAGMEAIR